MFQIWGGGGTISTENRFHVQGEAVFRLPFRFPTDALAKGSSIKMPIRGRGNRGADGPIQGQEVRGANPAGRVGEVKRSAFFATVNLRAARQNVPAGIR